MPSRRSILKGVLSGIIAAPFVAPRPPSPRHLMPRSGARFLPAENRSVEARPCRTARIALPLAKLYTNTSQQYCQTC